MLTFLNQPCLKQTLAIGVALSHDGFPWLFSAKNLCSDLELASLYTREMFVIIESVKNGRQYLSEYAFHNCINHETQFPFNSNRHNARQQKCTSKLQCFLFIFSTNLVKQILWWMHFRKGFVPIFVSISSLVLKHHEFYTTTTWGNNFISKLHLQ